MEVTVISSTKNPQHVAAFAARTCYGSTLTDWTTAHGRNEFANWYDKSGENLLRNCIKNGHNSIFEHVSFTFFVSGVSRSLSHQWVRHRIGCSPSQRSQRYCREGEFEYVVPPSISENSQAFYDYMDTMEYINKMYEKFLNYYKIKPEDARYVLPNACETELTFTFNVTSFRHFLKLRLDKHAQWEIREMAGTMLQELLKHNREFGIFFEDFNNK